MDGVGQMAFDDAAMVPPAKYLEQGATFDGSGAYRYRLWRRWSADRLGVLLWVMLNPSTADAAILDPTIRRCEAFARLWGYDALEVVNLFAWRSTDPAALYRAGDPVGPENDSIIRASARLASAIVCAWGAEKIATERGRMVRAALHHIQQEQRVSKVRCLGMMKDGSPRHPLYLAASTTLEGF